MGNKEKRSRPDFKNRNISLPETDFLKGKLMMVYSGADTQRETLSPAAVEWSGVEGSVRSANFKPLSDSCQRRSGKRKASRRGHRQEDHYRTLATRHYDSKTLIKLSFRGLVGRVVRRHCCALRGRIEGKVIENEGWDFLLGAEKTLLSCYKKWCKMIR